MGKLDDNSPNGVVFEDQIMTIEMYNGIKGKFIPVLARGTFKTSFSDMMGVLVGYDLSDANKYEEEVKKLAADLWNEPKNKAPEPGVKPTSF